MSGGWPTAGTIRSQAVVWVQDIQGRTTPFFANDNSIGALRRPPHGLPSNEVFRTERRIAQTFGRKAVEEVAEDILVRTITPKHPLMKAVDLALDAWDIYQLVRPGEELPRDPDVARDVEISFPGTWTHYNWRSDNEFIVASEKGAFTYDGTVEWSRPDWGQPGGNETVYRAAGTEVTPFDIVGVPNPGSSVGISGRTNPIPGYGAQWIGWEGWYAPPGDTNAPEWANAPRTGTVVTTVMLPASPPTPAPRWQDLPGQARHPNSDEGYDLAPTTRPIEVPWVPPSIVFNPSPDGSPGNTPGQSPSVSPGAAPGVATGVAVSPNPSPLTRSPPGPGEHEGKVRAKRGKVPMAIYSLAGGTTEALDMLKAAWSTLPDSCKSNKMRIWSSRKQEYFYRTIHHATPQSMSQDIWNCRDHFNMALAVRAMAEQAGEDILWSIPGQIDRFVSGRGGRDRGFMFGPWDQEFGNMVEQHRQAVAHKKRQDAKARRKERAARKAYKKASREGRKADAATRRATRGGEPAMTYYRPRRVTRVGRSKLIRVK